MRRLIAMGVNSTIAFAKDKLKSLRPGITCSLVITPVIYNFPHQRFIYFLHFSPPDP
ncbi:hypothetical protein WG954_03395 [Lacibacter sp. H375]|uniref:hypothetical protein n=1 Tax=Lacibacter sp. H375 TaxID=3133424 RepID=UPI0030C19214